MDTSKQMTKVMLELTRKHEIDLSFPGAYMKLERPAMMPLVVDTTSEEIVRVYHFYIQEGDVMLDPEIVFWRPLGAMEPAFGWVPISYTQHSLGIYEEVTILKDGKPDKWYPAKQRDLARFADQWARNIRDQRWLEAGELTHRITAAGEWKRETNSDPV